MTQKTHLGSFLRKARLKKKMSQIELSKHLKCTSQFICNWENGSSYPPIKALVIMKDVLEIPANQLLEALVKESRAPYEKIFKSK